MDPVHEIRNLTLLFNGRERIPHPGLVIPVVVERVGGLVFVNAGDLIEHLSQRAPPREQVTDHAVQLSQLTEASACVRQPSQDFGRLSVVGRQIEE